MARLDKGDQLSCIAGLDISAGVNRREGSSEGDLFLNSVSPYFALLRAEIRGSLQPGLLQMESLLPGGGRFLYAVHQYSPDKEDGQEKLKVGPFHEGRWGIETVMLLPPLQSARRRRFQFVSGKNRGP